MAYNVTARNCQIVIVGVQCDCGCTVYCALCIVVKGILLVIALDAGPLA